MALVLAIEPDLRQAEILTRIVREKVKADVVIVDSRDAAMEAMRARMPDVMLLSALLSPRDEDELVAYLRTLDTAEHLQTHTIPQLASGNGKGRSGGGGGLLKAFRRRKHAESEVAGCDPEHFADEIRVFLEQAEQKRFELAEELKYRPAIRPMAAPQAKVEDAAEPSPPVATTSWDSPFEWRRSDAPPPPLVAFEEEARSITFRPEAPRESDAFGAGHRLDVSSLEPDSPRVIEDLPAPALLADLAASLDPAPPPLADLVASLDLQALPPYEPEAAAAPEPEVPAPLEAEAAHAPIEAQTAPTAEGERAEPEPAPFVINVQPAQAFEPETPWPIEQPEAIDVPPATEVPALEAEIPGEIEPATVERVAGSAGPIADLITFGGISDAIVDSVTFDLAALDESARPIEAESPLVATPEEIEAFGRIESPATIEWIADDPVVEDNVEKVHEVGIGDAQPAPELSAAAAFSDEPVDIDLDSLAVSVEDACEDAEIEAPAPRKLPPALGPLASWARLEGKAGDDRRPGSDMREIIERLAVPPHIAGVSYARGVRIRRVRVAGTRGRRRPMDQSGPVILSRRTLAATRSNGPGATA